MTRSPQPLVSFVVAAHNAAPTVGATVESVLRQSVHRLELIVVDDGSDDETGDVLAKVDDPRVRILRNETRSGLAASLNRALDAAHGRYLARLDADDLALPVRLERQLRRIREGTPLVVLGSGVLEFDDGGRLFRVHEPPVGPSAVRWHALFGAPFFHPTVLVDRELLDAHELRYDSSFGESEDYDLWTRLLAVAEGDNLREPLVLRRVHAGQASRRRQSLQRSLQRSVALREIARVAPSLTPAEMDLAWCAGSGLGVDPGDAPDAADALERLFESFAEARGREISDARPALARAIARLAEVGPPTERTRLAARALRVDPMLPGHVAAARARRRRVSRSARQEARRLLSATGAGRGEPVRVTVVSPEPTPYRSPLFDRIAARAEVELTVLYAGRTVASREWEVEPRHRAVFLPGVRVPGARKALRHDYPVTPTVFRALADARPDVAVVNGWSTFAAQAAIAWARIHDVPYLLLVSSHDAVDRPRWRKLVRRPIVPPIVRRAWGAFALGTLSRESLVATGIPPDRVRLFANTIDVAAFGDACGRLAAKREELRRSFGVGSADTLVLSAGRLVPEKGYPALVEAVALADRRSSLALVIAGSGPLASELEALGRELDVRLLLPGHLTTEELMEAYVAADLFALVSEWEPWGVVVNEAAACGLPLVLSESVGAAADLLVDGENGILVRTGDADAVAAALERLASDRSFRASAGSRSREIVRGWGYEPSVESFVTTVREAAGR